MATGSARDAVPQGSAIASQRALVLERGREHDELLAAPARDGVVACEARVASRAATSTSTASPIWCP